VIISGTNDILLAGGLSDAGAGTRICDRYNASTGLVAQTGNIAIQRFKFAGVAMPNKIMLCGGDGGGLTSSCEIYDPTSGLFSLTGSLNFARGYHAGVLLSGLESPFFCGGYESQSVTNTCELYNTTTGQFAISSQMVLPRSVFTMTTLADGNVLSCGGWTVRNSNSTVSSCELLSNLCYGFGFELPTLVCGNVLLLVSSSTALSGPGVWSVVPLSAGMFSNSQTATSTFTASFYNVPVTITWSSPTNCRVAKIVTFISNPTAVTTNTSLAGCGVSANLNVTVSGDATSGTWSGFLPGSIG
jgi:hypothetical protein